MCRGAKLRQGMADDILGSAFGKWTAGNFANGTVNLDGGSSTYGANFLVNTIANGKALITG